MKQILHFLSYPLTGLFYLTFGLSMLFFHAVEVICYNVFGYQALKKSVDYFNWTILRCLNLLGTRFEMDSLKNIPESTRSKNGQPKTFHRKGLITLFKYAPEAYILPITVNNSWKLQRNGHVPMPLGIRLKHTIHPALKISDFSSEELIDLVEETVKSKIVL